MKKIRIKIVKLRARRIGGIAERLCGRLGKRAKAVTATLISLITGTFCTLSSTYHMSRLEDIPTLSQGYEGGDLRPASSTRYPSDKEKISL
jgi:hypothetical protein